MAKIYNKIVESTTEPSKEDLWLKEGKIKKFKNGWEDIFGKQDVKIPTKISELENDSGFVENTSLGTAAYANVEDLQGGGNTSLQERHTINGDITYDYLSPFYSKEVRLWQAAITVSGNYSITFEFGEAGSVVVVENEISNTTYNTFVITQERIAARAKIEVLNSSGEVINTYFDKDLTSIYVSSTSYRHAIVYY